MTPTETSPGTGTAGRAFKRGIRGLFLGALSLYAAKKGMTLPLPIGAGDAADALGQAINIGVSLGADKLVRELWGRFRK